MLLCISNWTIDDVVQNFIGFFIRKADKDGTIAILEHLGLAPASKNFKKLNDANHF